VFGEFEGCKSAVKITVNLYNSNVILFIQNFTIKFFFRNRNILERNIKTIKMIRHESLNYHGVNEEAYTLDSDTSHHGYLLEILILISKFDLS